jgi:hypothetical protein
MKKSKVKTQLRKIATRDAMEKRRNGKQMDPFTALILAGKNRMSEKSDYDNYEDEEDYNYGEH